jgi:hypothetical protein
MDSHPNEGLLGSLLIYVSAIFGVLALLGVPIYYAAQPTVVENVGAQRVHTMLSARGSDDAFPVARLAAPEIFSPAVVTELHARAKEEDAKREMQAAAEERRARVAERASRSRDVQQARVEVHQTSTRVERSFAVRRAPASPSAAAY